MRETVINNGWRHNSMTVGPNRKIVFMEVQIIAETLLKLNSFHSFRAGGRPSSLFLQRTEREEMGLTTPSPTLIPISAEVSWSRAKLTLEMLCRR